MNKQAFNKARQHTKLTPGQAINTLRSLQGLSQNKLAELTGISQPNLSSLENDARQLGRDRAITLARALRVHPAVLLFPDYDMDEAA